ncbi:MAG: hypothetical protein C0467_24700 [Planctomycetaceae bacterium]|nr:hypothetical protein [Planctomycetaceae bacterium]
MIDTDSLPEGWTQTTINELCELNPKHSPVPKDDTEVSFVPMAAVSDTEGRITQPEIRRYGEVKKGYTHFADGDVIFAKITPCMENGKAASVRGMVNGVACGTTEFFVFRSRGAIDQDFLFHFLRQESFRRAARATMQSGVGQARVPKEFVLNSQLPLPPLPEQQRIVARIEELQARSQKAREELEAIQPLLVQFRQSALAAAFRGHLTAEWRELHPGSESTAALMTRLKSVGKSSQSSRATTTTIPGDYALSVGNCDLPTPASWSWVRLTEVAKLETGHTPSRKQSEYWDGEIPWVCIKDASRNHGTVIDKTLQNVTELGLANSAARLLPAGTVCLTRTANSIGYSLVLGRSMATSQDLVGWVCSEAVNPKYLMYLFIAENDALYRFAKGSTHPTVYFPEILSFHVCLPPVEEQREIVARIESCLAKIESQSKQVRGLLADLAMLEQSILATAFRGELVEQDPADEPVTVLLERIRASRNGTMKHAEQIAQPTSKLLATRYVVMVLRELKLKVARTVLETCLVLMLNDDARRSILGKKSASRAKKTKSNRTHVPSLDYLLGELVVAKILTEPKIVKNAQVFGLDIKAPTDADIAAHATALDKQRLAETLQTIEVVGEERARLQLDSISHVNYELVPG